MGRAPRLELGGSSRKLLTKNRLRKAREALRCADATLHYTTVGNIYIYIYIYTQYIYICNNNECNINIFNTGWMDGRTDRRTYTYDTYYVTHVLHPCHTETSHALTATRAYPS